MEGVRALMEKAVEDGKLEEMCNRKDAAEKTPFEMAAAGASTRCVERFIIDCFIHLV